MFSSVVIYVHTYFRTVCCFFFLMIRLPPRSTRTDTLFPTRRSSDLLMADDLADTDVLLVRSVTQVNEQLLDGTGVRSEEQTSELQSLMRISYAVFCLNKKKNKKISREIKIKTRQQQKDKMKY